MAVATAEPELRPEAVAGNRLRLDFGLFYG